MSETDPLSAPSDAQTPRVCTGIASKHALIAHFVHPTETGETTNQRSNCVIPAHAGTQRLSESGPHSALSDAQTPPECTGIASKRALTAHFVPPTETGEATNQRSNCIIPAQAGTQRLSETGPHSASSDAQTPRMCTGNASKYALIAHFLHRTGDRRDRQPAIEMHHSRACGTPKVAGNRSSFSAIGCPDAPYVHRKCIQKCTDCALRAPHRYRQDIQPPTGKCPWCESIYRSTRCVPTSRLPPPHGTAMSTG